MKRVLFSLAAAALSFVLGVGSAAAGDPCGQPAPCCKTKEVCCKTKSKCCPEKACCKSACKADCGPCKVCKPEPIKIPVAIVTYACRKEDYCLTKCPPMDRPNLKLPCLNLNLKGKLCEKMCNTCNHQCAQPCPQKCEQPCKVCQNCDKVRTRNVLIKRISICEEDGYMCVPVVKECHHQHHEAPALPPGEKLSSPGDK